MISIVTVSYNAASTIEQTISSVIGQTYRNIEYIVIDGGSTDGTAEIIKSHEHELSFWISEPDRGISDAMNKGLDRASGYYILFLNADDYLADKRSIERVAPSLDCEIVTAPIVKLEENQTERIVKPRGFGWWFNLKTGLFHQATFCSKKMLLDLKGFDTRYKLEMDYDLFLRAYRMNVPVRLIDHPFSVMRSGGISTRNDTVTLKSRFAEEKLIHYRNCPNDLMRLIYSMYWHVYPPYKLLRGRIDRLHH